MHFSIILYFEVRHIIKLYEGIIHNIIITIKVPDVLTSFVKSNKSSAGLIVCNMTVVVILLAIQSLGKEQAPVHDCASIS